MSDEKFWARMPDGTGTTSQQEYADAWGSIMREVEEKLGVTCVGCDPGIHIQDKKEVGSTVFSIPVWFAKLVLEKLDEAEELSKR